MIDKQFKTIEIVPASARPDEPKIERKTGVSKAVPQVGQPELKRKKLAIIPVLCKLSAKFCLRKLRIKNNTPTNTDWIKVIIVRNKKSGNERPIPKTAKMVFMRSTILPLKFDSKKICQLAVPAAKKFNKNPNTIKVIKKGIRN